LGTQDLHHGRKVRIDSGKVAFTLDGAIGCQTVWGWRGHGNGSSRCQPHRLGAVVIGLGQVERIGSSPLRAHDAEHPGLAGSAAPCLPRPHIVTAARPHVAVRAVGHGIALPEDRYVEAQPGPQERRTGAASTSGPAGTTHSRPAPDMGLLTDLPYVQGRTLLMDQAAVLVEACRAGCRPCQNFLIPLVAAHPATVAALVGVALGTLPPACPCSWARRPWGVLDLTAGPAARRFGFVDIYAVATVPEETRPV